MTVDPRTSPATHGNRCDKPTDHDGRHSFTSWNVTCGADPNLVYLPDERTDMPKQVIENSQPEENGELP